MLQGITAAREEFLRDVARGLEKPPYRIPPKYFYDETGSALFEEITRQPEYYLTRVEASILRRAAPRIRALVDENVSLVELGSGSSTKTRILLEGFLEGAARLRYLPIDISATILEQSSTELDDRYPELDVTPIASQYDRGLATASRLVARDGEAGSMLVLFLGSSIGNMDPDEAVDFLTRVRRRLSKNDRLLVGFDLVKDESILNAAYNDAAGVTARFNLNLLSRINRELSGDFDVDRFSHLAFYRSEEERVEIYVVSEERQIVRIEALGRSVAFDDGERIHTENSYKYRKSGIEDFAARSGLSVIELFTDEDRWFALALFAPA